MLKIGELVVQVDCLVEIICYYEKEELLFEFIWLQLNYWFYGVCYVEWL